MRATGQANDMLALKRRPFSRGMTMLEVMVTVLILAVAITAALTTFATHVRGARLSEERRLALQAAHAKIDELRARVAGGESLELLFQRYGPFDFKGIAGAGSGSSGMSADDVSLKEYLEDAASPGLGTGSLSIPLKGSGAHTTADASGYLRNPDGTGDYSTFVVGEDYNNNGTLDPGEDLNGNGRLDVYLAPLAGRPMGSVSIITDEMPNEGDFGYIYGQTVDTASADWYERNPFGLDITGNRSFNDLSPSPFPLDINGDGDSNDGEIPDLLVNGNAAKPNASDVCDRIVYDGFRFIPIVVTIQWNSPYGPERVDVFAIIVREHP